MTVIRSYLVTANHMNVARNLNREEIIAVFDGKYWHARHRDLGCGKNANDSVAAIRMLLDDWAYYMRDVMIEAQP